MDASPDNNTIDSSEIFCHRRFSDTARAPMHPPRPSIPPYPVTIRALGAQGIMLQAHDFTHLFQKLEFGVGDD
jgi:hypothetical protein